VVVKHFDCTDNAEVVLYKLIAGGHEWPDTNVISARELIMEFFAKHLADTACHTVTKHDTRYRRCYQHTNWAKTDGITQHPGLYGNLTKESSFAEFQAMVHRRVYSNCPNPCSLAGEAKLQLMPRPERGVDEHRGEAEEADEHSSAGRSSTQLGDSKRLVKNQVKDSPRVGRQHVGDRHDDVKPAKSAAPQPAKHSFFWGQAGRYLLGSGVLLVVISAISFLMPRLKAARRSLLQEGATLDLCHFG